MPSAVAEARAVARTAGYVQHVQTAAAVCQKLAAKNMEISTLNANQLTQMCNAAELESLLKIADPQAKKGTKGQNAARIVECISNLTAALPDAEADGAGGGGGPAPQDRE